MTMTQEITDETIRNALYEDDIEFFKTHYGAYDLNHRLKEEDNDTLLLLSIAFQDSSLYRFFLENGANPMLCNDLGENILHSMIFSNEVQRLEEVLTLCPSCIKLLNVSENQLRMTPLHASIVLGNRAFFEAFLKFGADIQKLAHKHYSTLHLACYFPFEDPNDNLEIVKELIHRGANPFIKSQDGFYPLSLAINCGLDVVAEFLIKEFGFRYGDTDNSSKNVRFERGRISSKTKRE